MPIAIVESCMKSKGWLTGLGKKIAKKNPSYTHKQVCEGVASTVENAQKKAKRAKGGTNEQIRAVSCFSQATKAVGGAETNGVWVMAMEDGAVLLDTFGRPHPVSEAAHLAALDYWVKESPAWGEIDHKPDTRVPVTVNEAKYDFGRGLYLLLDSTDPTERKKIADGVYKPSIDVVFTEECLGDDGEIMAYRPNDVIGLMYEGAPQSPNAGPDRAGTHAVSGQGGIMMSDEPTPGATEPTPDPNAPPKPEGQQPTEPPKGEPTPPAADQPAPKDEGANKPAPEELSAEEQLKQLKEKADAQEKELLELKEKAAAAEKDQPAREAMEKELRTNYMSKLPETLRAHVSDSTPIEKLKEMVTISELVKAENDAAFKARQDELAKEGITLEQPGTRKMGVGEGEMSMDRVRELQKDDPTFKKRPELRKKS